LPPGPLKIGLTANTDRKEVIVAAGLITLLSIAALSTYNLWVPPLEIEPFVYTPHDYIEIVDDADFAATALLEGWPGDGSPEDPYIIDGLEIDRGGTVGLGMLCIGISNTRVSFIISNCNLTRAIEYSMSTYWGSGISLHNVSNGVIVNNTCSNNDRCGIILRDSDSNTLINNYCYNNSGGIGLFESSSNTVFNNICNNNGGGIDLYVAEYNTVTNNTCTNNTIGISLSRSESNTVANNTCTSNDIGIYLSSYYGPMSNNTVTTNTCNNNRIGISLGEGIVYSNLVWDNTCLDNTEHDILGEFETEEDETEEYDPEAPEVPEVLLLIGSVGYMGLIAITLLGGLIVGNRVSKREY
jgi:parallel beta-helix repeat protein